MKNKKLIIIVTATILLVLGVVGATYAWFTANIEGNEEASSVVVTTATLSLTYFNGQEIRGENILPGWSEEKEFTVQNNGQNDVYYKIEWENITNTFVNKSDLTYTITGTNTPKNLTQTQVPDTGTNVAVLENIKIAPGETHTYTMNITYANREADQSSDIGKLLTGKIAIKESEATYCELNPNALVCQAKEGDFVAYTPSEATWQTTVVKPSSQGNFGGWTASQDKSTSVTCLGSYANEYASGWRVLSNEEGIIKLISAGTPECYCHAYGQSAASVALLTATQGENAAVEKYGSDLAESVKYFDKTDLDTWNKAEVAYDTIITNNLIKTGTVYWLASSFYSNGLWRVSYNGNVYFDNAIALGLRPLITLKSNIQVTSGDGSSIENAYQITL